MFIKGKIPSEDDCVKCAFSDFRHDQVSEDKIDMFLLNAND